MPRPAATRRPRCSGVGAWGSNSPAGRGEGGEPAVDTGVFDDRYSQGEGPVADDRPAYAARYVVRMGTKSLGASAAVVAGLATVTLGISVAMELPQAVRIAAIAVGVVLLVAAGGFIGAAVSAQRKANSD